MKKKNDKLKLNIQFFASDAEIKFKVVLDDNNTGKKLDDFSDKGEKAGGTLSKVGSIGKTAFKALAVGVGTATTAVAGFIGKSVQMAGELEQQIGGTEAVFKDFATNVQEQAKSAYSTMGLSANDYMATMNKMGSLMQGSGLSIETSMNLSSQAMQRAADVASIMGIDVNSAMESIAGAAKGNFTMMDNLGVAMNATTIEAYAMSKGIKKSYDEMSNGEKVQIAMEMFLEKSTYAMGNYTKENKTFAGSLTTMKAAISNFMSGAGDINTVVESVMSFAEILIQKIGEVAPSIINGIVSAAPQILEAGGQIIQSLISGIGNNQEQLIETIMSTMTMLLNGIISMLPDILQMGIELIVQLILGIAQQAPQLIPTIIDCMLLLVETLIDNLDLIIDAGIELILALIEGIFNALPDLIAKLPELILKICTALLKLIFVQIPKLGQSIVEKIVEGLFSYYSKMIQKIKDFFKGTIFEPIVNKVADMASAGLDLIKGLWNGIKDAKKWLMDKVKGFFNGVVDGIKDLFGIHSPSKLFFEIGGYLDEGFIEGIEDMEKDVQKQMDSTFGSGLDYLYNGYNNFNATMPDTAFTSIPSQTIYINSTNNNNSTLEIDGKVVAEIVNNYNEEREVAV